MLGVALQNQDVNDCATLHHKPLLLNIVQRHRHRTPVGRHGHRRGHVLMRKSLCMRPTRPNPIVFGLGALGPPDAAGRVVERRMPEAGIRIVEVAQCAGAGHGGVARRAPAEGRHVWRRAAAGGAVGGGLEGLGWAECVGVGGWRGFALRVAGE
jgi:hypothetical protein